MNLKKKETSSLFTVYSVYSVNFQGFVLFCFLWRKDTWVTMREESVLLWKREVPAEGTESRIKSQNSWVLAGGSLL
jgi:hypothetical protein